MLLAQPLSAAFRPAAPATRAAVPARAMVALLLVALTAARLAMPLPLGDSRTRPVSALAAVPLETAGQPVLNDYGFGGYLIHRGVRSFIDGRADMYGDPFIKAYDRAVGGDRAALERTLAEHEIAWTIFHPRRPAVRALDDMPGWRRLYADDYAVVHVRSEPLAMSLRGPLPR